MNQETETVYCVKYPLTQGIFAVEGHETEKGRFICTADRFHQSFSANEWARDADAAMKLAEEARQKKIQSLQKQLKKVQNQTIKFREAGK